MTTNIESNGIMAPIISLRARYRGETDGEVLLVIRGEGFAWLPKRRIASKVRKKRNIEQEILLYNF